MNNRKKGKETPGGTDVPEVRQEQEKGRKDQPRIETEENPFEILRELEVNTDIETKETEQ